MPQENYMFLNEPLRFGPDTQACASQTTRSLAWAGEAFLYVKKIYF